MPSVNKVILIGHLGQNPDSKTTNTGGKIVSFSVATTESWKDKSTGEKKDRTEWHRVVIFNENLASVAERYLKKGSKVYLEGQLQTRKWTDNSGQEKYTTEVVLQKFGGSLLCLDGRPSGEEGHVSQQAVHSVVSDAENARNAHKPSSRHEPQGDIFDDDIPF